MLIAVTCMVRVPVGAPLLVGSSYRYMYMYRYNTYMYSRRLLSFIVWKALEYEPAFEQGDAAGRGGCRSRCSVSPGGVTAATKGGYHFPSGGLNLTPLTPPALRSVPHCVVSL